MLLSVNVYSLIIVYKTRQGREFAELCQAVIEFSRTLLPERKCWQDGLKNSVFFVCSLIGGLVQRPLRFETNYLHRKGCTVS